MGRYARDRGGWIDQVPGFREAWGEVRDRGLRGLLGEVPVAARRLVGLAFPRGSLDQTFGMGGRITTDFFEGNEPDPTKNGNDVLLQVAQDAHARVLAVGRAAYSYHCRAEIAVARYTADGVPDDTYGTILGPGGSPTNTTRVAYGAPGPGPGGPPLPDLPPEVGDLLEQGVNPWTVRPEACAVDGDSLVVAANVMLNWPCLCGEPGGVPEFPGCGEAAHDHLRLVRIDPSGNVDPTLDWRELDLGLGSPDLAVGALGTMPGGGIVVAGTYWEQDQGPGRVLVARLDGAGEPDPAFHGTGTWLPDFGVGGGIWDLAVQDDGKVVLAGGLGSSLLLMRLLPDGTPDPVFGTNGRVVTDTGYGWGTYLALEPAAAARDPAVVVCSHAALFRFRADGSRDLGFGSGGTAVRPLALWPGGLGLGADGTIYVAGTVPGPSRPLLRRAFVEAFRPGGSLDSSFSLLGRGHIEFDLQPGRGCFTPGGRAYWGARSEPPSWHRHYGRVRRGQGLLVQPNRVVVGTTTEVPKTDRNLDVALDFGLVGVRT